MLSFGSVCHIKKINFREAEIKSITKGLLLENNLEQIFKKGRGKTREAQVGMCTEMLPANHHIPGGQAVLMLMGFHVILLVFHKHLFT